MLQVAGILTIAAVDRFVVDVAGTAVLPLALDTYGLYDVGLEIFSSLALGIQTKSCGRLSRALGTTSTSSLSNTVDINSICHVCGANKKPLQASIVEPTTRVCSNK